jgi:hypothetical protein
MAKQTRQVAREMAPKASGPSIDGDGEPDLAAMASDLPRPEASVAREVVRENRPLGPGEFLGRNGEILSLKRRPDQNLFEIPKHLQDPNYTYEWKRYTVYGKQDTTHQVSLAENGWRPVTVQPGSPFSGHYMPADHVGAIIREDLMLMERPRGLTDLVREQEKKRARDQLVANQQRYTSRQGVDTPQGFNTSNPNVPAEIKTGYDVGPGQAKHIPIE